MYGGSDMPIHDWTRVDPGTFHDFHRGWTVGLSNALNSGVLPARYFAMIEQRTKGLDGHELMQPLTTAEEEDADRSIGGGVSIAATPPRAQRVLRMPDVNFYTGIANPIAIRDTDGRLIAVVEILSPGSKHSIGAFRTFVEKSAHLIISSVHLLVVDLFPPTRHDPDGMAKAIWDQFAEDEMPLPKGRALTLSACDAGPERTIYAYYCAAGEVLPEVPLFIRPGVYVSVPLESTYQSAWRVFPAPLKRLLDG
jgi:hypothetical protein